MCQERAEHGFETGLARNSRTIRRNPLGRYTRNRESDACSHASMGRAMFADKAKATEGFAGKLSGELIQEFPWGLGRCETGGRQLHSIDSRCSRNRVTVRNRFTIRDLFKPQQMYLISGDCIA